MLLLSITTEAGGNSVDVYRMSHVLNSLILVIRQSIWRTVYLLYAIAGEWYKRLMEHFKRFRLLRSFMDAIYA